MFFFFWGGGGFTKLPEFCGEAKCYLSTLDPDAGNNPRKRFVLASFGEWEIESCLAAYEIVDRSCLRIIQLELPCEENTIYYICTYLYIVLWTVRRYLFFQVQ